MSFQGNWLGFTSGSWFGDLIVGAGVTIRIFRRISKARTERISKLNHTITDLGDGTYNVVQYSGISQDLVNSISYEGYEIV